MTHAHLRSELASAQKTNMDEGQNGGDPPVNSGVGFLEPLSFFETGSPVDLHKLEVAGIQFGWVGELNASVNATMNDESTMSFTEKCYNFTDKNRSQVDSRHPRTLATSIAGDAYVPGALVMWYTTNAHLTVPIDNFLVLAYNLSQESLASLKRAGAEIQSVDNLHLTSRHSFKDRYGSYESQYLMFNRLRVFGLSPQKYGKIVFLDADILVVADISRLWDAASISAVADTGASVVAPEFNAGVMVFDPSPSLYEAMIKRLNSTYSCGYRATDQSFLCSFFYKTWCHLPEQYNRLLKKTRKPRLPCKDRIWNTECDAVYHFNGAKPWKCPDFSCYGSEWSSVLKEWHTAYEEVEHRLRMESAKGSSVSS